jgi:succinate dehydrogenase hydrophobic anchor subunit
MIENLVVKSSLCLMVLFLTMRLYVMVFKEDDNSKTKEEINKSNKVYFFLFFLYPSVTGILSVFLIHSLFFLFICRKLNYTNVRKEFLS